MEHIMWNILNPKYYICMINRYCKHWEKLDEWGDRHKIYLAEKRILNKACRKHAIGTKARNKAEAKYKKYTKN